MVLGLGNPGPASPPAFEKIINCSTSVSPNFSSWLASIPPQISALLLQILVLLHCKFSGGRSPGDVLLSWNISQDSQCWFSLRKSICS